MINIYLKVLKLLLTDETENKENWCQHGIANNGGAGW